MTRGRDATLARPESAERLTAELATRVMGWSVAPDRFLTGNRGWMPRWRFAPFVRLEDAFQLLDRAATSYTLHGLDDGTFSVEVLVGTRVGKAVGERKATAISLAIARALDLEHQ